MSTIDELTIGEAQRKLAEADELRKFLGRSVDALESNNIMAMTKGRAVVVVDRGWIFAGDVTEQNGRIYLDRAVWVFRWESVGFAAVVEDPKKAKADIRKLSTRVDLPKDSEIFRCPVSENWGL